MKLFTQIDYTASNEGLRLKAYDDETGEDAPVGGVCKGTLTIGYGQTGMMVHPGMEIDEETARIWLERRLAIAESDATWVVGMPWLGLNKARQIALCDMAYQLGRNGLAGFHTTIGAIRAGAWSEASTAMMASQWAKQTPKRAARNAQIINGGQPPDGWKL